MSKSKKAIFALAAGCMILTALAPIFATADNSQGAEISNIDIAPGMRYTYKPTYPADLSVTTIIKSQTITGADAWGTMSNGTLIVKVPKDTALKTYDVVLEGKSSNPTQTVEIPIKFTVKGNLTASGTQANVVVNQDIDFTPAVTGLGTKTWAVTSGATLPAGLSLDPTTGKVTGKITTAGDYTIKLTVSNQYGEKADLVVSFSVKSTLEITNSPTNGVIIYEV